MYGNAPYMTPWLFAGLISIPDVINDAYGWVAIQTAQTIIVYKYYQLNFYGKHLFSVLIYTHYELVLGVSGHEIAWNFDFPIEQNQRLSNAKSRILWLRKV